MAIPLGLARDAIWFIFGPDSPQEMIVEVHCGFLLARTGWCPDATEGCVSSSHEPQLDDSSSLLPNDRSEPVGDVVLDSSSSGAF
jgi:hypothetical protein